jgi:hypothetical protein
MEEPSVQPSGKDSPPTEAIPRPDSQPAGEQPLAEGDRRKGHLSSVEGPPPTPPSEPPTGEQGADALMKDAELKRFKEETRSTKIDNDLKKEQGEIKNRGLARRQVTSDRERYFLMGFMLFGSIASIAMTILGIAHQEPAFYAGTGLGALITGGSAFGLNTRMPGRGRRGKKGKRGKSGKPGK